MSEDRTHGADSAINDEEAMLTPEQQEERKFHQFSKLADLARKSTEDHITGFVDAATAPLLDTYNLHYAVLCGTVSAAVTALVGASDTAGDDASTQASALSGLVDQMASVFNEIQERKAIAAAGPAVILQ